MTRVAASSGEAWLNIILVMVLASAWTGLDPGTAPYAAEKLSVTAGQLGLYYLLAGGVYALAGLIWGKMYDLVDNSYPLMAGSLLLGCISLLMIAPPPRLLTADRTLLAAGLTLREMSMGCAFIPTLANTLRAAVAAGLSNSLATQAYVAGVWSSAFFLGQAMGPLVVGFLDDKYGFPPTVAGLAAIVAAMAATAAAQAVFRHRQLQRQMEQEKTPLLPKNHLQNSEIHTLA